MKFTIIKSCLARFSGTFAVGTPSNIHGTAISYRCAKFGAFVNSVTIMTLRDLTKESKEEKEKINKVTKNLLLWEIEPRPSEYVRTKNEHLYPVDHLGKSWHGKSKRSIYSLSMVIDSFQG